MGLYMLLVPGAHGRSITVSTGDRSVLSFAKVSCLTASVAVVLTEKLSRTRCTLQCCKYHLVAPALLLYYPAPVITPAVSLLKREDDVHTAPI